MVQHVAYETHQHEIPVTPRCIFALMTNEEARIAVLNHISEFFVLLLGDEPLEEYEEAGEFGDEVAEYLLGSIGLEVVSVDGDAITVTLALQDNAEYLNDWLAEDADGSN